MIITRAQSASNNQANHTFMDEYSANDSDISLPGFSLQNINARNNNQQMIDCERDHERLRIEQGFNDMNRQIGELTSLVRALTEKIASSNRKENDTNTQRFRTPSHSDNHCCSAL